MRRDREQDARADGLSDEVRELTVIMNVEIGGQRKHVIGYLEEFLFPPERARATRPLASATVPLMLTAAA